MNNPFIELKEKIRANNIRFDELNHETRKYLFWKFYQDEYHEKREHSYELKELTGKAEAIKFIGFLITEWIYNDKCRNFIKTKDKDFRPDKKQLLNEWEQTRIKPIYKTITYGKPRTTRII